MPPAKKTTKTKKPVQVLSPKLAATLPPLTTPPPLPFTPVTLPPAAPTGVVTITLAERDALVAKLFDAERMFLGGYPIGAKPMIAEVAAKLASL